MVEQADVCSFFSRLQLAGIDFIDVNRGNPALLADLPVVQRLSRFVVEQDGSFAYGGANLLLGVMAGSVPAFAGGDPDAARGHFERALLAADRRFLMAQVLYAETYAIAL